MSPVACLIECASPADWRALKRLAAGRPDILGWPTAAGWLFPVGLGHPRVVELLHACGVVRLEVTP